jgi:hypothetical protein
MIILKSMYSIKNKKIFYNCVIFESKQNRVLPNLGIFIIFYIN